MSEADTSELLSKQGLEGMMRALKHKAGDPEYSQKIDLPFTDMSGSMSGRLEETDFGKRNNAPGYIKINASDYTKKDISHLIGPPPGYKAPPLTPEERAALKDALRDITEVFSKSASIRNGEKLAAQCHAGVPTEGMKPLRLRLKSSAALGAFL